MGILALFIFCFSTVSDAEANRFCKFFSRFFFGSEIYTPNISDVHSVTRKAIEDAQRAKESVEVTSNKIAGIVGRCVLNPPDQVSENQLKGPINYDTLVLPYMTGAKSFTPAESPLFLQARDLNIPGLNAQSLVEIDSLARTIYAEMAKCAPIGDEYLLAIARVIKNRTDAVESRRGYVFTKHPKASHLKIIKAGREFINSEDDHWPGKDTASKVSSSPVQFSAWNSYVIDFDALNDARDDEIQSLISKKMSKAKAKKKAEESIKANPKTLKYYKFNESGLLQTLCPPSSKTKKFFTGGKPSVAMQAIWKSTVKVAVEATLYPEQFIARTRHMANVLNYTSDRKNFLDFTQVHPMVDGRPIDNDKCINLWVDTSK